MSLSQSHQGLVVRSTSFGDHENIPSKFTCDGENINPGLRVDNVPENAKSLVLIMDDPDAPMGMWVHWVVWNIDPEGEIRENSVPGVEGISSYQKHSYGGPCPPNGKHRYFFKVYALDIKLNIGADSDKADVESAMRDHVMAQGELIGFYERH